MRFSFAHSHAFQGSRLAVEDAEMSEGMCVVEFGDGVAMIGEWHPDGGDIHLAVPAYRTAKVRTSMRGAGDWCETRTDLAVISPILTVSRGLQYHDVHRTPANVTL